MLMAGADVTMLCSALLRHGIDHIRTIETGMCEWMDEHEYESVAPAAGQHEPEELLRPGGVRARPVHARRPILQAQATA